MSDHEAIRQLIALYSQRLDDGDFAGMGALFSEDAVFVSVPPPGPDGEARPFWRADGRDAIVAGVAGSMAPVLAEGRCVHLCSQPVIDMQADIADAAWDFAVVRTVNGASFISTTGRYHARFARSNGGWRFTRRIALQGTARLPAELTD